MNQRPQRNTSKRSRTSTQKRAQKRPQNHRKSTKSKKKSLKIWSMPHGKIISILLLIAILTSCVAIVEEVVLDGRYRHLKMTDLQECQDKQEYLDLVMPIYKKYGKDFDIKYPGILALQVFYEVGSGFPQQLSEVAKVDNNLGGLKYTEGVPHAKKGLDCPANEGGNYCHFDRVSDYIYAQCWQVGQPLYDNVRKHQSSVEDFARSLCNLWIGGQEGSEPFGYSEDLVADYHYYHLDK